MNRRLRLLLLGATLAAVGIGAGALRSGESAAVGSTLPADADQVLREASDIDGLLAVVAQRDGDTVLEGYFDGTEPDDLLHLRSVTKSVLALLIGIALDQGHLESVDQTLGEILAERVERFGARKAALTVEQLLTMSAGLEWNEDRDVDEFNRLVTARDPLAHYLGRPFVAAPGDRWAYSSGASHLLSAVLTAATGVSAADYARQHLFAPLGIERFRWPALADGHSNGAAGLQLRPRDLLRIGELVLAGGSWDGHRVVSRSWIETATRGRFEADEETSYGYHWWNLSTVSFEAWLAQGHGGQSLSVLPEQKVLFVVNSRWRSTGRPVSEQSREVGRFIRNRLAPFLVPELAAAQDRSARR